MGVQSKQPKRMAKTTSKTKKSARSIKTTKMFGAKKIQGPALTPQEQEQSFRHKILPLTIVVSSAICFALLFGIYWGFANFTIILSKANIPSPFFSQAVGCGYSQYGYCYDGLTANEAYRNNLNFYQGPCSAIETCILPSVLASGNDNGYPGCDGTSDNPYRCCRDQGKVPASNGTDCCWANPDGNMDKCFANLCTGGCQAQLDGCPDDGGSFSGPPFRCYDDGADPCTQNLPGCQACKTLHPDVPICAGYPECSICSLQSCDLCGNGHIECCKAGGGWSAEPDFLPGDLIELCRQFINPSADGTFIPPQNDPLWQQCRRLCDLYPDSNACKCAEDNDPDACLEICKLYPTSSVCENPCKLHPQEEVCKDYCELFPQSPACDDDGYQ